MKKIYLVLLTALSFTVASAQFVTPMNASTVAELKEVEWTFPGLRNATTKVRYWISPTEVGFTAAFDFTIARDANNNITSMVTTNINVNNPPATKFSNIGVVNGNRLNVQVKTADPQTADPFVDYKKETIFKNALGKDSLVVIERLNNQNQYDEFRRIQLVYNANGSIIALKELSPASDNYELVGFRNFGYMGSKRVTDTTYTVGQGVNEVVAYNKLFYTATDKLDSVLSFSVKQGVASIDAGYRMYYDANPGIAKILVTSVTPTDTSFEYRIDYIGGITVQAPTVTTGTKSNITTSGATLRGIISSDGGSSLKASGIVVSTSPSPIRGGSGVIDSASNVLTSPIEFSVNIGGLDSSTTYYYRAYATNSVGIAYSIQDSFTTASVVSALNESNLLNENNFVCFPVPANNELNVTANNGELYNYTMFDIYGKKITSVNLSNQATINTVNMASGVYLLNIQDANGNSATKKITIQH
jgi:hypothetical protein